MKNVMFVVNNFGVNEIVNDMKLLEGIKESDWEVVEVDSSIVSKYEMFDGIGRISFDSKFLKEVVLEEVNSLDEELW
jgi:hypothetical protein